MTFFQFNLQQEVTVYPWRHLNENSTFGFPGTIKSKKIAHPGTSYERNEYQVLIPRARGRFQPEILLKGIIEEEMEPR